MHKLKTLFAAACAFVACSAFAWTPGLEGGTVSAAPGSDKGKTGMPTTTSVYLHPEAASSTTSPGDTVYVYTGRIYLDGTYAFGSYFDDSVQLTIDGELVIAIYNNWSTYKTATITKSAGWYDIDVRVGNTGWGMGPCDNARVKNPATEELESCGFGYKKLEAGETPPTANSGASMNFYYRLVDDGTGSFLRCNKDGRGYEFAWGKLKRVGSSYVVDVKIDRDSVSSVDFTVQLTDSDGQTKESVLAKGVTSSTWVSYPLSGLEANKSYLVTLIASAGVANYDEINLGATCPSAVSLASSGSVDVNADSAATITVTRGTDEESLAYPLIVNLTYSGTAVVGLDVEAVSSVTIPAGASSASIEVKPLLNDSASTDRTLVVALADGAYPSSSETVSISVAKPNWGWTMDTSAKTITERVESGTPWVINVSVSGSDLTLKSTKTVGTSTVIDFRKVIATTEGAKFKIVANSESTFMNKSTITEVYLPESMTTLGTSFCDTCANLTKVQLSSKVKSIKSWVFSNCANLRSVTPFLPDTLTEIGEGAFNNCYRLPLALRLGFAQTSTGEPLAITIGGRSFKQCKAMPSVEIGPGVTVLPYEMFMSCWALKTVSLPENITTINNDCFNDCKALETVTPFLPDTLTKLGAHVFHNCTSLTGDLKVGQGGSFSAGEGDGGEFGYTLVSSVTIKNMPVVSRGFCRNMTSLTSVTVDDVTTEFGLGAFQNCTSLKSFTLPANTKIIGQDCFNTCTALETVTPFLPDTVTTIYAHAFHNCPALKGDLVIGEKGPVSVANSGAGMFRYAKLTSATLKNFSAIPEGLLYGVSTLTSVTLDDQPTEFGNSAFNGCSSLTEFAFPPNVTKIGNDCFANCSSLKTVTPLLPETLTAIGSSAFNGCTSLEGELEYAVNQSSATLGANAFQNCYALTKITIGDAITALPHDCFNNCKALKSVRYSPNLTSIDYNCFANCTELSKVEPALLPLTITAVGESAFNNCKKLNQPVKFWPATTMEKTKNWIFNGDNTQVGIPLIDVGVNVQKLGEYFVNNLDSLRYLIMRNPTLDWYNNTFRDWSDYQGALVIHRDRTAWSNGTSLEDTAVMIPWASLSDDKKKKYTDLFPCDPEPRGLIADGNSYSSGTYPRRQWILSYGIVTPGVKNLMINAQPSWYGATAVSPSYGTHKSITVPMDVTSPSYVEEGGNVLYGNKGYVLEVSGDFGWEPVATNLFEEAAYGTTRTIAYTTDTDGDKRITWLWEPAAYTVAVLQPTDPNVGSVTLSKGSLGGYFKIGETATITANNGTGSFVKWHGDVPAGHEKDNPLEVTIDGPKNITPEFTQPWTFDSTAKTISDGYWVINATRGSDGNYTISSPKTVPALAILDLAKGMASGDSGMITKIADNAFNNNQSRTLVEVRLPETLKVISGGAFANNPLLKTVTPFLPASVDTLGDSVFENCPLLESDLYIRKDGGDMTYNGGRKAYQFKTTGIKKVVFGPDITQVPGEGFCNCSQLKTVVLSEKTVEIRSSAFSNCTSLETVEPFFPASVTSIKSYAFNNCPKLLGTAYIGTNGVEVALEEGVFNSSGTEVIHLGEGIKMLPKKLCCDNKKLKAITMSENVTNIGESAFSSCSSLETVTPLLPANLAHMKHGAFYNTPKLKSHVSIATNGIPVTFPSGAESWFNSSGITSIYIGEGLKNTPRYFCHLCHSLTNVVFADGGTTNIASDSFRQCNTLTSVKLPSDLISIGPAAFNTNPKLKTVTPFLPDTIRTVGRNAFQDCTSLVSPLTLEAKKVKGVRPTIDFTTSGDSAQFWNCSKIPSLTVGEVTALKGTAFGYMKSVKNFYIKKKTPFEVSGSQNFKEWTARQSRWFIPKTGWESWLEANVTLWADVSSDDKGDYHDAYPGAKDAYGMVKTSYQGLSGGQWVILWNPEPVGFLFIIR